MTYYHMAFRLQKQHYIKTKAAHIKWIKIELDF